MKSTKEQLPHRSDQAIFRINLDGSAAIMRLDQDRHFYTLEGVSVEVWQSLDGKTSLDKIVKTLAKKHKQTEAQLSKDIQKLIKDLKKERLLNA